MDTLRFITCGSVDDGKSTLIGRLLFESKSIFDDQLIALATDSKKYGTQGERIDFALLVDGLQAEREQGITIDVAYRFFSTHERRFMVADTPGHEQYTRNMATGASTAGVAIILVDARKGILIQTRRHSRIVAMMGIRHVILAVNKMDLIGFNNLIFDQIVFDYKEFAKSLNFSTFHSIPVSGLDGDNIMRNSHRTPWYQGFSLIHLLNTMIVEEPREESSLRLPIQWVNRPHLDFRGFCGTIAAGTVQAGDAIRVLPSGITTTVKAVWQGFNEVSLAKAGDAIMLTLTEEVDISRGNVIAAAESPPEFADQFSARLLWLNQQPMSPGRQYLLKLHCSEVTATVTGIKFKENVNTGEELAAKSLELNEIGTVHLSTSTPLVFESYAKNRTLGGFILIDKYSFETVGAGMLNFSLRRSNNIHWQNLTINKVTRAAHKNQTPRCLWFTGLSGSGKSTIANLLEKQLLASGYHTYLLDGDNVRHGLNRDLGFTEADRIENIRRVTEVAKLMVDAGLLVLVSFIAPFHAERQMARNQFSSGEFIEVFIDTPLEECEKRDVKGLYAKARSGNLPNFTGIDSPYEIPHEAEIHLRTVDSTPLECTEIILSYLKNHIK
jgi:bifunctional enzyme CysN/CysC